MTRLQSAAFSASILFQFLSAMAAQPTTARANWSGETRADRELAERSAKLDAEYRAKKADLLRRYVDQLTEAKRALIRAGKKADAQRIYEAIADANAKIDELVPTTEAAIPPATSFSLKIADYNGAAGFARVVNVTPTELSITSENDYGRPSKVVWKATLTAPQRDRLSKFMKNFPLDRLQDSYIDRDVMDGCQVCFTLQKGNDPPRQITVCNRRQPNLERLINEVNELLPPTYLVSKLGK